ncbi:MAG: hypothetical protein NT086_12445 [Proteobacteria bacterium]|nr:hypothetical protein [Pseudomonadota bacterium]
MGTSQQTRDAVDKGWMTHDQASTVDPYYLKNSVDTGGANPVMHEMYVASPRATPTPSAYTGPITRAVQDNELTSKNLAALSDRGSPLITRSRTNAIETAAERGMGNSGMAAQSGEQGALSVMLPVAQADANTYSSTAAANQGYQNQFGLQGNQFAFQSSESEKDRNQATGLLQRNIDAQFGLQANQQGFQGGQAKLDRDQAAGLQQNQQTFQRSENTLDRNQNTGLLQRNLDSQRDLQLERLKVGAEQSGLDRSARANEFTQTLTKQNDQFFAQNNLDRDSLVARSKMAADTLNAQQYSNYIQGKMNILDGTHPNKDEMIKGWDSLFLGPSDGYQNFKLRIDPAALTPVAPIRPTFMTNPPAENQPAVYDPLLNQSSNRVPRNRMEEH